MLTLHPITIKNYYMLLEEGGFIKSKIEAKTLLRYLLLRLLCNNIFVIDLKLLNIQYSVCVCICISV